MSLFWTLWWVFAIVFIFSLFWTLWWVFAIVFIFFVISLRLSKIDWYYWIVIVKHTFSVVLFIVCGFTSLRIFAPKSLPFENTGIRQLQNWLVGLGRHATANAYNCAPVRRISTVSYPLRNPKLHFSDFVVSPVIGKDMRLRCPLLCAWWQVRDWAARWVESGPRRRPPGSRCGGVGLRTAPLPLLGARGARHPVSAACWRSWLRQWFCLLFADFGKESH
jgi:hypothetical protein